MVQQDILYVRHANLNDLNITHDIVRVINDAFKVPAEKKGWTTSEGEIVDGARTTPEEVESYIKETEARPLLLAFDRSVQPERVIATLQIQPNNDKEAKLGLISVDPAYQSRGVGGRLLRFTFEHGRELGFETYTIHVFETRIEILAWYKKLGFVDTGKRIPYHTPHRLKAQVPFVVLTKELVEEIP